MSAQKSVATSPLEVEESAKTLTFTLSTPDASTSASSSSSAPAPLGNLEHSLGPDYEHFGTAAIHAGQPYDPVTGAVIPPISLSTTFAQKSPGVKYPAELEYSRSNNPTRHMLEVCLATLEGGEHGFCFSSGLAATSALIHLLESGDHVISVDDVYGGTQRYFRRIAAKFGVTFDFIDMSDEAKIEAAFKPNTKMVWIETPTNPTLKCVDIALVAQVCKRHNALLCVDNTFSTPFLQQPLALGADIVVHSATKYLNGHSDVVMGVVVLNGDELNTKLRFLQNGIGSVPSPFDCFMVLRGLKTLHLRMKAHVEGAKHIAELLEKHPKVERVIYPGLPSHPQYELAKRQMKAPGGMITFFVNGGLEESKRFLEHLKIFALAESLGGVESLAEHPAIMTHASVPAEHRAALGISDSLIRLSVGVEDVRDLEKDILEALDAI